MTQKKGIVATATALLTALAISLFGTSGPGWKEIPATQVIRYQAVERSVGEWGPSRDLGNTLDVLRVRLRNHMGDSFSIREWNTNQWSAKRNLDKTILRLHDILNGTKVGEKYLVKAWSDGFTQRTRTVDIDPTAWADTEGTYAVDIIVGTIRKNYPNITIGGIYACRTIAGSYNLSQHAYANAVDVSGSHDAMNAVAHGIYAIRNWVPVSQVLWNYRNLFTGNYVYDHTNHVHFSGSPLMSGGCRRP